MCLRLIAGGSRVVSWWTSIYYCLMWHYKTFGNGVALPMALNSHSVSEKQLHSKPRWLPLLPLQWECSKRPVKCQVKWAHRVFGHLKRDSKFTGSIQLSPKGTTNGIRNIKTTKHRKWTGNFSHQAIKSTWLLFRLIQLCNFEDYEQLLRSLVTQQLNI